MSRNGEGAASRRRATERHAACGGRAGARRSVLANRTSPPPGRGGRRAGGRGGRGRGGGQHRSPAGGRRGWGRRRDQGQTWGCGGETAKRHAASGGMAGAQRGVLLGSRTTAACVVNATDRQSPPPPGDGGWGGLNDTTTGSQSAGGRARGPGGWGTNRGRGEVSRLLVTALGWPEIIKREFKSRHRRRKAAGSCACSSAEGVP